MHESHKDEKIAFTIQEVSELTSLSVPYLYKLSSSGILPVSKIGARVIVLSSDLHMFLREHSRANAIKSQKRKLGGE